MHSWSHLRGLYLVPIEQLEDMDMIYIPLRGSMTFFKSDSLDTVSLDCLVFFCVSLVSSLVVLNPSALAKRDGYLRFGGVKARSNLPV